MISTAGMASLPSNVGLLNVSKQFDDHASAAAIPEWFENMMKVAGESSVEGVERDPVEFFLRRIYIEYDDVTTDWVKTPDR